MTRPVLRVQNLMKEFKVGRDRTLTAVNSVTFTIHEGETLALVGESGSGKTTAGRCILRVLEPDGGSLLLGELDITHLRQRQLRPHRKRMQVVFQDPYDSLNPRMTVARIVAEPLEEFVRLDEAEKRERVRELLVQVGLTQDVEGLYPHKLTSGQQQRVAIARALALEPDLLILDEPTSSLDPIAREGIISLLRSLQERLGTAFLFISHDLVTVRHVSHRIAVMYLGEIVEEGPVAQVFEHPVHPYTRALLGSAPSIDRAVAARHPVVLAGEIPSPIDLPPGCFLASRCPFVLNECRERRPTLKPSEAGQLSRCLRTTGDLPRIEKHESPVRQTTDEEIKAKEKHAFSRDGGGIG